LFCIEGVLIAGLVAVGAAPKSREPLLSGTVGAVVVLAAVAALCFFLVRAGRRLEGAASNVPPG
jgi:hypothetical protein